MKDTKPETTKTETTKQDTGEKRQQVFVALSEKEKSFLIAVINNISLPVKHLEAISQLKTEILQNKIDKIGASAIMRFINPYVSMVNGIKNKMNCTINMNTEKEKIPVSK